MVSVEIVLIKEEKAEKMFKKNIIRIFVQTDLSK